MSKAEELIQKFRDMNQDAQRNVIEKMRNRGEEDFAKFLKQIYDIQQGRKDVEDSVEDFKKMVKDLE
jgi:hypothetical protein